MMVTGPRQGRAISRVEGTRRGGAAGWGVAAIVSWAGDVSCRLTWHNKKMVYEGPDALWCGTRGLK